MTDDFERTTAKFGMKVSKVTAAALFKGAFWLLKKLLSHEKTGIVSIGNLMKDGCELASMGMNSPDFQALARVMKRYNIGVSLIRHADSNKYTVFFKAKNNTQFAAALKEYLRITLKEMPDLMNTTEAQEFQKAAHLPEKDSHDNANFIDFREPPQPDGKAPVSPHPSSPSSTPNLAYSENNIQSVVMIKPPPRSIKRELEEARVTSRAMQAEFQSKQAEKTHSRERSERTR